MKDHNNPLADETICAEIARLEAKRPKTGAERALLFKLRKSVGVSAIRRNSWSGKD
jgi:hypothetical protein